ncbi:aspartate kinase [Sorangium cellulosum]|uniref:Aspartokinase n=1 Tax=Sorangium cellulosum TaxID=56 RepID=A0A2L0F386_SORCE|nr:aspartate kinase [Sorangium cellulosum]AUX46048.1 aspartate kinase [Sorangium cellulosum]
MAEQPPNRVQHEGSPSEPIASPARVGRPILVQKYGGSSVADVDRIGKVADRVVAAKRAGSDVVVVVSAMGKTTDGLLALARQAANAGLGAGAAADPPRRELDMLLSTGERVSMALLSIAIQARGFEAISFTGSQSGILTNDRHFDARIIEVRPFRIEDELARGRIVIVAGYQGMSYRREITTLGRGGSDTTAVALAAALGAERCEIYSDVDGVYSADPRVVPDARHLPELDCAVLQEMAECGAKVVCAQAVEWARRSGVALYARSTFDALDALDGADAPRAGSGAKQTVVRRFAPGSAPRARAIVAEGNVVLARVHGGLKLDELLRAAGDLGIGLRDLSFAGGGGAFVIPLLNVPDWQGAKRRITALLPAVELAEGLASVSVVGDGLTATAEPLARFVDVLGRAGITPRLTVAGPLRLGALIAASEAEPAQRLLHASFVEA